MEMDHPQDFGELAAAYPHLQRFLIPLNGHMARPRKWTLDFGNPEAVRELLYAHLWVWHRLRLQIPLDSLCPPVLNRRSYLSWIAETLVTSSRDSVSIIDIGTGASCIYPLLGCACYPDWTFLATEASESSAEWATENVERNPFISDRIQVLQTSGDTVLPISYLNSHPDKQFTLTMSNPPFYASRTEMQESLEAKAGPPTTVCMGSEGELLTQGGELSFVRQHFNESLDFGERIQWFTSLVGKRSNWETLKAEISKDPRVQQVKSHFFQAGRTVRWIIAWSFATESLAVKAKEESVQKDSEGGKRITKRARLNGPT